MVTKDEKLAHAWSLVVAMAWEDEEIETEMFANPRGMLAERGVELPDQLSVRVVRGDKAESEEGALLLPYPERPLRELSDDELDAVAGGVSPLAMDSSGLGELEALRFTIETRLVDLNPVGLLRLQLPVSYH